MTFTPHSMTHHITNVLLVGSGGVGTLIAYALEMSGLRCRLCCMPNNHNAVKDAASRIDSLH